MLGSFNTLEKFAEEYVSKLAPLRGKEARQLRVSLQEIILTLRAWEKQAPSEMEQGQLIHYLSALVKQSNEILRDQRRD